MPDPFHKRFTIEVPIEEARKRFVNRIANRVRKMASSLSFDDRLNGLLWEVEATLGEPHSRYIEHGREGESTFVGRWSKIVADDFLRCLHAVEGLYKGLQGISEVDFDSIQALNDAVAETLSESEFDVGVSWQDGFFLRKGAEILDERLVNENLRWLADPKYEIVLVPFQKGLSHLLEGTKNPERYGDTVTDMYEALEATAKITSGKPTKDLSALREEFIAKLRLSEAHKEMLKVYIAYGNDFRHAIKTGQRRAWPLEHEAESFVYIDRIVYPVGDSVGDAK